MKISLNWLKSYVAFSVSPDQLAHQLTMAGLEVEKISSVGGDRVFELEITPNRPDCLNMIGIAREVAAIFNKPLKEPRLTRSAKIKTKCDISIVDQKGCARYLGVVIENVSVGATPDWIKKCVEALGDRSINNIVDITNFCLMEMGQPLHAFDYDKLNGGKIIVRRASQGEKIVTIDGIERVLDPSILVIADAKKPVAIAGIMGGQETEVTENTKNILLESAYFDPVLIRRASRKLGLTSDSSYRFERGVNWALVEATSWRAVSLILQSARGTITKRSDVAYVKPIKTKPTITLSLDRVNTYLGMNIAIARCQKVLKNLGFSVTTQKNILKVIPPTHRSDIKLDVDVIEEISRIIGYDHVPISMPSIIAGEVLPPPKRLIRKILREVFLAQGFSEAINYSMINQRSLDKSLQGELVGIKIQNPLTQDQEMLRPSMLPSLLTSVLTNINRGQGALQLFEMGKVYLFKGEHETLGLVVAGAIHNDWRRPKQNTIDFYDIKGSVEQALMRIGVSDLSFVVCDAKFFEAGQASKILVNGEEIGVVGKINEEALENWDIKEKNVFFAEVDLEAVYRLANCEKYYTPIAEFPAIVRDVSIAVKKDITFNQVCDTIFKVKSDILAHVKFNEEYLGDKIPADSRGLIFSLIFQSPKRTLREEEVTAVHSRITTALVENLKAVIR